MTTYTATARPRGSPPPEPGPPTVPDPPDPPALREPFPLAALPPVMQTYVDEYAQVMGCPPEYVALPLLAVAAGAIGASRTLRLRDTWCAPALLWCAVVGRSGTGKSPPLEHALSPLRRRQALAYRDYAAAMAEYRATEALHERDAARWRRDRHSDAEPPAAPPEPVCPRHILDDTTLEALAAVLAQTPRGVLVARDEVGGWLESMDAYRDAGDLQRWLSIHRAGPMTVDRRTSEPRVVHIARAHVSLVGGIQPDILRRMMTRERVESGLMARILLAAPDAPAKRWTDRDVSVHTREAWATTVDALLALAMGTDADSELEPVALSLDGDARARWTEWYDDIAQRTAEADGPVAAALAKVEEYGARLALVLALVRDPTTTVVDGAAMQAGIVLAGWFAAEAERIYGAYAQSPEERAQAELVALIQERFAGRVTARELKRASRRYQPTAKAECALESLIAAGVARWEAAVTGGRRTTMVCVLSGVATLPDATWPQNGQKMEQLAAATVATPPPAQATPPPTPAPYGPEYDAPDDPPLDMEMATAEATLASEAGVNL